MTTNPPSGGRAGKRRANTPDSHDFPTRPYDLVKEFVIALVVVLVLSVGLAAIFSSPDEKAITTMLSPQQAGSFPAPPRVPRTVRHTTAPPTARSSGRCHCRSGVGSGF